MNDIYIKGLEKALEYNCYVEIFMDKRDEMRVLVKREAENLVNGVEVIADSVGKNLKKALGVASNYILGNNFDNCQCIGKASDTFIDGVLKVGYELKIIKLSTNQVMVGFYRDDMNICQMPVIADDIKAALTMLNRECGQFKAINRSFDLDDDEVLDNFYRYMKEYGREIPCQTKKRVR